MLCAGVLILAGCVSVASDQRDSFESEGRAAFDRNTQARNAALAEFARAHPDARELEGRPTSFDHHDDNGDLVIEQRGCTCINSWACDPGSMESHRVYVRPDGSVLILQVTPTVHVRYVGERCAPDCGGGRDERPLRYAVPASSKTERWELTYPYELVEPREKACTGSR